MERTERINATAQVVNSVKSAIQSGQLKVGDRLPRDSVMAQELGVGRSSLREGIKILNAYGVVESRQGEGTFIVDNRAQNFFEFMGFLPSKENTEYFLELRRVIEIGNIAAIYDKLTDEDLEELRKLVQVLGQKRPADEYVTADKEFHSKMIAFTKNPMLIQINNMITSMRIELLYKLFCHQEIVEDAYKAHSRILTALEARDLNACVREVADHIDTTVRHVENIY